MNFSRNKLYAILFVACLTGYAWLYFNLTTNVSDSHSEIGCLIKHTTGIPCPSCGSTRAINSIAHGNFIDALQINPLGYVVAILMLVIPIWIIVDITTKKKSFLELYLKSEVWLKRPQYAIPLILLVLINWIWNISKGL